MSRRDVIKRAADGMTVVLRAIWEFAVVGTFAAQHELRSRRESPAG
jgi:hypothetical protein